MAHKVAEFGEFKDCVTVECENGAVFHIEKEKFLLIEAIARKICKEEFDGRGNEKRLQSTGTRHDKTGEGKPNTDNENGVHKVDSETDKNVS